MSRYKLGKTKKEREENFINIVEMFENGTSLEEISKLYGATKQAVSLFLQKRGYFPGKEYTRVKNEKMQKFIDQGILEEIKKLRKEKRHIETMMYQSKTNAHFYAIQLQGARKTMNKILNLVEELIKEHEKSGYYTLYSEAQDSIQGPEPENAYDHFYDVGRYDCLLRVRDDIKTLMEED